MNVKRHNQGGVVQRVITDQDVALLTTIVRSEYGTHLRTALAAHPEWKKALSHVNIATLSARVYAIKKRLAKEEGGAAPVAVVEPKAKRTYTRRTPQLNGSSPTTGAPGQLSYCPRCGEHLGMWAQVAEVMKGLP